MRKFKLLFFLFFLTSPCFATSSVETDTKLGIGSARSADKNFSNIKDRPFIQSNLKKYFFDSPSDGELEMEFRAYDDLSTSNSGAAELRKLILRKKGEYYSLNVGLQDISWSETFGMNILDIVNPRDYSEFVFSDLSWAKIPVWAWNSVFNFHKSTVQLIYNPAFRKDILPSTNSFYDPLPTSLRGIPRRGYRDSQIIDDSEYGVRFGQLFDFGLDLNLLYFSSMNRNPTYVLSSDSGLPLLEPIQKRVSTYGASFSMPLMELILRGDFLYVQDGPLFTKDFSSKTGERSAGILGVDYTTSEGETTYGSQFHFDSQYKKHWISLQIKTSFFDGKWNLTLMNFSGIDNHDAWFRPRFTLYFQENYSFDVWGDFIYGKSGEAVMGAYSKADHIETCFTVRF